MNNRERLESHKRMYSWIEEKTKKNCYLDEDYKRNDWEILTDLYPELLTLVEDLISNVETLVNQEQELITHPLSDIKFDEVVGTVYKWTKEPNDKFIGEENIVQKLDEKRLEALGLLGNVQITNSRQIEYLSQYMDTDIDLDEYDYFFEYYE